MTQNNPFVEKRLAEIRRNYIWIGDAVIEDLRAALTEAFEAGRFSLLEEPVQQTIDVALDALRSEIRKEIEKVLDENFLFEAGYLKNREEKWQRFGRNEMVEKVRRYFLNLPSLTPPPARGKVCPGWKLFDAEGWLQWCDAYCANCLQEDCPHKPEKPLENKNHAKRTLARVDILESRTSGAGRN